VGVEKSFGHEKAKVERRKNVAGRLSQHLLGKAEQSAIAKFFRKDANS
jgi:hypothetical protein